MPRIYLSPSTQEGNFYVTGGSEELYMNKVADAMEPYLLSNGIRYTRNTPDMTAASSVRQANEGYYDLYVSLHSNAAVNYGTVRGSDMYYYTYGRNSKRFADILVTLFKTIYPLPDKVRAIPTTSLIEVAKSIAPAVLLEVAFHDNVLDANWITANIELIAETVVHAICIYFDIPFVDAIEPYMAKVTVSNGNLNIRSKPSLHASIVSRASNGSDIKVLGTWEDWYVVEYNGVIGYAFSDYIQ